MVLDILLPKTNGIAIAKSLRDSNNKIHISFLTALTDYESLENAKKYENHCITKPYELDNLFKNVNKFITQ